MASAGPPRGRDAIVEEIERKLAAIMMADIVGFSASTGEDDEGTLRRVRAIEHEIIRPKTIEHHGRVVKTLGDGFLCEFPSVVEAFRCAITIQDAMQGHHHGEESADPMQLRIGIDFGDIIIDDNDVFGDGVNIAARIEALADPGGICVSERAREQLRRFEVDFEDIGEQRLKNIKGSVRVFRVNSGGPAGRAERGWRWLRNRRRALIAGGAVAIAVVVGAYFLLREPPLTPREFVAQEIENRDCAWLRISDYDEGTEGVAIELSGATTSPEALSQNLMQLAAQNGIALDRVEVRDVFPAQPDQCLWLVKLRSYRYTGIPRLVTDDAEATDREGMTSFTLTFDPDDLAEHVQLFSIDPSGEMVAIPGGNRAALVAEGMSREDMADNDIRVLPNGDLERKIFANHSGWGGFMIMEADAPIDPETVLGLGDSRDDIAAFDALAERDNWRFELLWLYSDPS